MDARPTHPPANFRSLPAELRLAILNYTHLGPAETGGYEFRFTYLRIVPCAARGEHGPTHRHVPALQLCPSPRAHRTHSPPCRCRIIPTALFSVDRLMRTEAQAVFFPNARFMLDCASFVDVLSVLGQIFPRDGRGNVSPACRHLEITISQAQCTAWIPSDAQHTRTQFDMLAKNSTPGPQLAKQDVLAQWRTVVAWLAANTQASQLHLNVEVFEDAYFLTDPDMGMLPEDEQDVLIIKEELEQYKWIYEFYVDITTALCALKGLGELSIGVFLFEQLKPWLEREVTGRGIVVPPVPTDLLERSWWEDLWGPVGFWKMAPPWHDSEQRLPGSNYHPEDIVGSLKGGAVGISDKLGES